MKKKIEEVKKCLTRQNFVELAGTPGGSWDCGPDALGLQVLYWFLCELREGEARNWVARNRQGLRELPVSCG